LRRLLAWRTGTSPLRRGLGRWLGLFLASVPAWWLFELLNRFLGNWEYVGAIARTPLGYGVYASICFSTVIPAVFTTAEVVRSFGWPARLARGPRVPMAARQAVGWACLGLVLLLGVVAIPRYFFPATWLCLFFLLDPLNHLAGWPSVTSRVRQGDWRLVGLLGAAALVCGFFWEMWNSQADPKWVYHVPLASYGLAGTPVARKVFEMPLLGYLGYIPFGLELYAFYQTLVGLLGRWDVDLVFDH
jgi:hypothetical protein